jgi:hypothetical protein
MDKTKARAAIVIVIGGERGEGFSVQTGDLRVMAFLPEIIEQVAASIRSDRLRALVDGWRPAQGESEP